MGGSSWPLQAEYSSTLKCYTFVLKEENVVLGKSELELQEIIVVPYYIFVGKNCLHFYNAIVKFILVFF